MHVVGKTGFSTWFRSFRSERVEIGDTCGSGCNHSLLCLQQCCLRSIGPNLQSGLPPIAVAHGALWPRQSCTVYCSTAIICPVCIHRKGTSRGTRLPHLRVIGGFERFVRRQHFLIVLDHHVIKRVRLKVECISALTCRVI